MTMQEQPGTQDNPELPVDDAAVAEAESTIDWKAKFDGAETARAQIEAERAKIENDLASLRGQRMTEAQREERLAAMSDDIQAIDRQLGALFKALSDNTTEELPAQGARIQSEAQQARAAREYDAQSQSLWDDLNTAIQDSDGNKILDLNTAPELEHMRQTWSMASSGLQSRTMGPLAAFALYAKAIGQAHRATKVELRKRFHAETQKAKEDAKASIKRQREEDGVLDLDTGPAAGGGGGGSHEAIWRAYGKGDIAWSAQVQRAGKALGVL